MLKPIVDSVIEKAPSRYALVIGVAKRAHEIVDEAQAEEIPLVEKPVGIAVDQLMNHKFEIIEGPAEPEEEIPCAPVSEADLDEQMPEQSDAENAE